MARQRRPQKLTRMIRLTILNIILFACFPAVLQPQDLDSLLSTITGEDNSNLTYGTFKGTTIVNSQTAEVPGHNDLHFLVSHRFGAVNTGLYNLFGLDQGTTRLGLEYGIKEMLGLSIGRSTYDKTVDGGFKIKVLRQQTGTRMIPVTISLYSAVFIKTTRWEYPERENLFSSRISYSTQLLIARKFGKNLSLQINPSYVHFNLVPTADYQNNIFAAGIGGRYKLVPKIALTGEYFYLSRGNSAGDYSGSLSLGADFETGGHVFQLHFTNSQLMFAPGYIARTEGKWKNGDIFIGFNIYRVFPLGGTAKNIY